MVEDLETTKITTLLLLQLRPRSNEPQHSPRRQGQRQPRGWWPPSTTVGLFAIPVFIVDTASPFVATPTRSLFMETVNATDSLENHQGKLQAEQVASSRHGFELTPYGAAAKLVNAATLLGFWVRVSPPAEC